MTQDEFRSAMNAAKREDRLLLVVHEGERGIALGYDSGTDEAILHGNKRVPLATLRESLCICTPGALPHVGCIEHGLRAGQPIMGVDRAELEPKS